MASSHLPPLLYPARTIFPNRCLPPGFLPVSLALQQWSRRLPQNLLIIGARLHRRYRVEAGEEERARILLFPLHLRTEQGSTHNVLALAWAEDHHAARSSSVSLSRPPFSLPVDAPIAANGHSRRRRLPSMSGKPVDTESAQSTPLHIDSEVDVDAQSTAAPRTTRRLAVQPLVFPSRRQLRRLRGSRIPAPMSPCVGYLSLRRPLKCPHDRRDSDSPPHRSNLLDLV